MRPMMKKFARILLYLTLNCILLAREASAQESWSATYTVPIVTLKSKVGDALAQLSYETKETFTTKGITYEETIQLQLPQGTYFQNGEEYRIYQCLKESMCRVYVITRSRKDGLSLQYQYAQYPEPTDVRDTQAAGQRWIYANYFSGSLQADNLVTQSYKNTVKYPKNQVEYDPFVPEVYATVSSNTKKIEAKLSEITISDFVEWDWLDYRSKEQILCGVGAELTFDLNAQVLVYGIIYIDKRGDGISTFEDRAVEYFENQAAFQSAQCNQQVRLTDTEDSYDGYTDNDKLYGPDGQSELVEEIELTEEGQQEGTERSVIYIGDEGLAEPGSGFAPDPFVAEDRQSNKSASTALQAQIISFVVGLMLYSAFDN